MYSVLKNYFFSTTAFQFLININNFSCSKCKPCYKNINIIEQHAKMPSSSRINKRQSTEQKEWKYHAFADSIVASRYVTGHSRWHCLLGLERLIWPSWLLRLLTRSLRVTGFMTHQRQLFGCCWCEDSLKTKKYFHPKISILFCYKSKLRKTF